MKWVPIRPFVDQPQIQNERNSAQNGHRLDTCASVRTASRAGPGPPRTGGGST
jgi:hypothetical protein